MSENKEPKETFAWKAYRRYYENFFERTNMPNILEENRKFYKGDQYAQGLDPSLPKPVMNQCFQYVEKVAPKIVGTPWAVEFTSDQDDISLKRFEDFYDYQMLQIGNKEYITDLVHASLIDTGSAMVTAYDEDSLGYKGDFRGFLTRKLIPLEDVFFANPHCEEIQDQEYVGYVQTIPVRTAWAILDKWGDKSLRKYIVNDSCDMKKEYTEDEMADKACTLVTRYFRTEDGEVAFELSTRYVNLFRKHHFLNPYKNERLLKEIKAEESARNSDDFEMEAERNVIQTPAEKESQSEYEKRAGVFWRYPIVIYRPYPVSGTVLGRSIVSQIIPNQKVINFLLMMNAMSAQNHGMPKWAVLEDALVDGEEINNDPSQTIHIKLRPGLGSIGNVIQRIEASNTSGDMLGLAKAVADQTAATYGYDGLAEDNSDSGYEYQLKQKQKNLVLEIPQSRLWKVIKDLAKTDIMFFRFYVSKASFYTKRDEGDMGYQNNMRNMSQAVGDVTGIKPGADENGTLPPVPRTLPEHVTQEDFLKDWEVTVEVTEGIASSQITETQQVMEMFKSWNTGNVDFQTRKMEAEIHPAFSRHTRQLLMHGIKEQENSIIAQKDAEIESLKAQVQQDQQYLQYYGQQIKFAQQQVEAYKKATIQNAEQNKAITQAAVQRAREAESTYNPVSGELLTQGEVKSNNALGINGTSFDTNGL